MVKLEKLYNLLYASEQRGKGLVSFVLVLLSNTSNQQEEFLQNEESIKIITAIIISVQFSRSVMSDSL